MRLNHAAQADLKLMILLSQFPEFCDYRDVLPYLNCCCCCCYWCCLCRFLYFLLLFFFVIVAIFMIQISVFFTWPRILQHRKIKKEFNKPSRYILFLFTMINKLKLHTYFWLCALDYSEHVFDCSVHYCNCSPINFDVLCHQWVGSIPDSTILLWWGIPLWYIFFVYKKKPQSSSRTLAIGFRELYYLIFT